MGTKGIKTMKHIVICGYHGFENSGDEALLQAMLDTLRAKSPDAHITVLSMRPRSTSSLYGVDSVHRFDPFRIARLFRKTDLLLFGGGSLLQDATSRKSLYYYLAVIRMAQKRGVKVMLYANGVGPLNHPLSRKLTKRVLDKVDLITLRDDDSDALLSEIGVTKPKTVVTADAAFTLRFDHLRADKGKDLLRTLGVPEGKPVAVVSVRPWKGAGANFCETLAAFCDEMIREYGVCPVLVPMQYKTDAPLARAIASAMNGTAYLPERGLTVDETFAVMQDAVFAVGMRLHTLIYASALEVPKYFPLPAAATLSIQPRSSAVTRYTDSTAPRMAAPSRYHCQETSDGAGELRRAVIRLPTMGVSVDSVTPPMRSFMRRTVRATSVGVQLR